MKRVSRSAILVVLLLAGAAPALAVGPVDVELGAGWWNTDLTVDGPQGSTSRGSGGPVLRADLWITNIGFRAAVYGTDNSLSGDSYASLELAFRPIAVTRNSYLALAVGYQENDYHRAGGGLFGTTEKATGVRLAADGRASLVGLLYVYGEAAWFPSLGSIGTETGGTIKDLSGREYEVGLAIHAAPWLFIRVGHRDVQTTGDTIELGVNTGETKFSSKGFLATLNFQF